MKNFSFPSHHTLLILVIFQQMAFEICPQKSIFNLKVTCFGVWLFGKVYQSLPVGNLFELNPVLSLWEKLFPLFRLECSMKSNQGRRKSQEWLVPGKRFEIEYGSTGFFWLFQVFFERCRAKENKNESDKLCATFNWSAQCLISS